MKRFTIAMGVLAVCWLGFTLFIQYANKPFEKKWNQKTSEETVLIVYHPDALNDFDKQLALVAGDRLAELGYTVILKTVSVRNIPYDRCDKLILISNTYNFAPDWSINQFVKDFDIEQKPVLAVTLGAGSTSRSKLILEKRPKKKGVKLLDSETYWLLRPNDEANPDADNIEVAKNNLRESISRVF